MTTINIYNSILSNGLGLLLKPNMLLKLIHLRLPINYINTLNTIVFSVNEYVGKKFNMLSQQTIELVGIS